MTNPKNGNARRAPGAFHKAGNQHRENTPTRPDAQPSPGAIGMAHYSRLFGTPAAAPPVYAILDRRRDGNPRIVGEYTDPAAARSAADLLRWAGSPAEVVLITSIEAAP